MIENDAPNPFLTDAEVAEALNSGIHALVASVALVIEQDPGMATAFTTAALYNLVSSFGTADPTTATRALLFEVSRYIHNHVDASVPIQEGERPESHEEVFKRDPRARVVTTAATEWFRLTCGQKDDAAANVLRAIHKEIHLPMVPQALTYVATVSVCSLANSVAHAMLHAEGDPE
jgi:hypothetical protein